MRAVQLPLARLRGVFQAIATLARPSPAVPEGRTPGPERRQLTVMFCDLVGSTALAARLAESGVALERGANPGALG